MTFEFKLLKTRSYTKDSKPESLQAYARSLQEAGSKSEETPSLQNPQASTVTEPAEAKNNLMHESTRAVRATSISATRPKPMPLQPGNVILTSGDFSTIADLEELVENQNALKENAEDPEMKNRLRRVKSGSYSDLHEVSKLQSPVTSPKKAQQLFSIADTKETRNED